MLMDTHHTPEIEDIENEYVSLDLRRSDGQSESSSSNSDVYESRTPSPPHVVTAPMNGSDCESLDSSSASERAPLLQNANNCEEAKDNKGTSVEELPQLQNWTFEYTVDIASVPRDNPEGCSESSSSSKSSLLTDV